MNILTQLANKHGTDKGSKEVRGLTPKNYTEHYFRHFNGFRNDVMVILEIGVRTGASLRMWADFFPNSQIVGLDIDLTAMQHETSRTAIHIGDQADAKFIENIIETYGSFDIVIDDGGHYTKQQQTSFRLLWDATTRVYCIEDLHTSFHPQYCNTEKHTVQWLTELATDTIRKNSDISSISLSKSLAVIHKTDKWSM